MNPAFVIVDTQRYFLDRNSTFWRWSEWEFPGVMNYLFNRCTQVIIPNISLMLNIFHCFQFPVIFLRLCGHKNNRSDLHRFFYEANKKAIKYGFQNLYPLFNDPLAGIDPRIAPEAGDIICDKTTFSGFASGNFQLVLKKLNVDTLVFAGLVTSQCVETTARDASDRGYSIIILEDACADYTELLHSMSLQVSASVCGGDIRNTAEFAKFLSDFR